MKKVLVIGPGGAGKSTLARRLGELLEIDVKHLDRFYWRAGWQEPAKDEWLNTVKELTSAPSWILDGNYGGTLATRIEHCDTIIFLDLPRLVCVWRIVKRRLFNRNRSRPDMAEGCNEKLDWSFVQWVWNYARDSRPQVVRLLAEHAATKQIVWLRSRAEVEEFLSTHYSNRNGT